MAKEALKEKVMSLFMTREEFERCVDAAIESGAIKYEQMEDDYFPAYAMTAGVYRHHIHWMQNSSSYPEKNARAKRLATKVFNAIFYIR